MPTMYRAAPVTQRDGSPQANSNCRLASAATGLDFHTLGAKTSTGAKMRQHSGDPEGGTASDDAVQAWDDGYSEALRVRDGHTWAEAEEDLEAGRLVHLDIWAASAGGPCLSGSGGYGHTIAVAPERDGDRWLVADPWCNPPKWKWWPRDDLRRGAEQWAGRCVRESAESGGPDRLEAIPRRELLRIVRRLMDRWTPAHPAPSDGADTAGSAAILYTTTRAQPGSDDVTINASGRVSTGYSIALQAGQHWYADSARQEKLGELSSDRVVPYIGIPVGSDARAIILTTSKPYDDGKDRPSIVYVSKGAGEPYPNDPDAPPGSREAEYREALESISDIAAEALEADGGA